MSLELPQRTDEFLERDKLIKEVEKSKVSPTFKTVDREKTTYSLSEKKRQAGKAENKYDPNFELVLKQVPFPDKWVTSGKQPDLHYDHDSIYRNSVELDKEKEKLDMPKKQQVLTKLYYEYENEATYKKFQKMEHIRSQSVYNREREAGITKQPRTLRSNLPNIEFLKTEESPKKAHSQVKIANKMKRAVDPKDVYESYVSM